MMDTDSNEDVKKPGNVTLCSCGCIKGSVICTLGLEEKDRPGLCKEVCTRAGHTDLCVWGQSGSRWSTTQGLGSLFRRLHVSMPPLSGYFAPSDIQAQ